MRSRVRAHVQVQFRHQDSMPPRTQLTKGGLVTQGSGQGSGVGARVMVWVRALCVDHPGVHRSAVAQQAAMYLVVHTQLPVTNIQTLTTAVPKR